MAMRTAPATIRAICLTRVPSRSPTRIGTRKSARVIPRWSNGTRLIRGWTIVIRAWLPLSSAFSPSRGGPSLPPDLLVLDCPDDRQLACKPGWIPGRQDRDTDAENGGQRDRGPRDRETEHRWPARQRTHQDRRYETGGNPQDGPCHADDPGLHDDGPPHLAGRHPGRPQDPQLADPFEDVHRQRVDDPERGNDHGDDRESVEQAEDTAERVVDGAGDPLERIRLEGQAAGGLLEDWSGVGLAARGVADREDICAGDAQLVGRVAPADEDRFAGPTRQRPVGNAHDPQVELLASAERQRQGSADPEMEPVGQGSRQDRRAAGIERRQRRG